MLDHFKFYRLSSWFRIFLKRLVKVSCKLEFFNVHNEDLSDDNESNDDNIETTAPPTSKRAKKGKPHKAAKWEKKHLNPASKPDQDNRTQALLLEHPENIGLIVRSSFEKVFLDIAPLLVEETNRYTNRDKNKPEFNVTLNEMLDFLVLFFYLDTVSGFQKKIIGVLILISAVMHFQKQ